VEDAERAVSSLRAKPSGLLRVTAGINATYLVPIISSFLQRYPEVSLEMFCTGRVVDLVEERFDVGIRAGALPESSLIARSLGNVTWFLVATPAYLKKHGRPRTPQELAKHDCLFFGAGARFELRLSSGDGATQVTLTPRLMVTDQDIVHGSAMAGLGIAMLPAFRCADDLRARRLERVLREWTAPSTPVHAVYPSTRYLSPKVKSFVEHLQERMTPPPWELGPLP
jgi:DNA-binding transcriptional LysR family regulator